jgi:beta-galactosidase
VTDHPNVIGDFTWTGWDYLGEAGIGRVALGDSTNAMGMQSFHGDYPWLTAWCGDIDITGHRRPQSHYREIVWGVHTGPFLCVQPPKDGKEVVHSSPWSWTSAVSSWTWACEEGAPITVEVYADADEVELLVNDRSLGRRPAGANHRYRSEFETTYECGTVEAIAWRGDAEIGRTSLRSATGTVLLDASADRSTIRHDGTDLAFVELTLVDEAGSLYNSADREITIEIEGPAVLQGFGSANPCTEESYTDAVHNTFYGRALAVIRPTGEGTIVVRAIAAGCAPQQIQIEASITPR